MKIRREQLGKRKTIHPSRGFSLIELLIVVSVILILAAIAIPNFIRSKMRANEAAAAANLRDITTAEVIYSTTYQVGYSSTLTILGGTGQIANQTNALLIDSALAAGHKTGYYYTYKVLTTDNSGHVVSYSLNADPLIAGETGDVHYYTDQTAVIRRNDTGTAGPNDIPIH